MQKLDFILNKLLPKKMIIIILATIFLAYSLIEGEHWFYLVLVYMGANVGGKFSHTLEKVLSPKEDKFLKEEQ